MTKGAAVRFIAGKYAGKKGWLNLEDNNGNNDVTGVIIDLNKKKGGKKTYVYTSSYCEDIKPEDVKNYAEAVLNQCPDIEKDLVGICRKFAKCNIQRDADGFMKVIHTTMNDAVEWQQNKGAKALYRKIEYDSKKKV